MTNSWPVEVVPQNPVACASALWRMDGFLRATIVVKATFGLVPDGTARMIAPEPIVARDRHHEQNPASSVEAPGEVVPYLPRAGVVLTGHAYGPGGVRVPAVSAHLAIVRDRVLVDKTIHVFGDRAAASPATPAHFQRMPLRYERAFGGPGIDANPIGMGAVAGSALPNLVDPEAPKRPIGFGPIAASWPARRGLLDATARARLDERIQDLAAGFPFGYFQPAPFDQQLEALEGDEWIILDGLHPALARVRTRLPSARGLARAAIGPGPLQPVELAADLLIIDADRQICSMIWRGHLVLAEGEATLARLRVHAGVEIPGRPIEWPRYDAPAVVAPAPATPTSGSAAASDDDDDLDEGFGATTALAVEELPEHLRSALPFAPSAQVARVPIAPAPVSPLREPVDDDDLDKGFGGTTATTVNELPEHLRAALPFTAAPSASAARVPAAPPPVSPRKTADDDDDLDKGFGGTTAATVNELPEHLRAALPFAAAPSARTTPPRDVPSIGTPWSASIGAPPPRHDIADEETAARPATPVTPSPQATPPTPDDAESTAFLSLAELEARAGRAIAPFSLAAPAASSAARPASLAGTPWAWNANDAHGNARDGGDANDGTTQTPAGPPLRGDKPAVPIVNPTPLMVVTLPWQVRPPRDSLTIVVKGTFDIVADGPARLRDEGPFPIGDVHLDDDPERSLAYASDLAYFKPKADVTLTGTAYAPGSAGGTTPAMQVAFQFGAGSRGFVRRAAVMGDRRWQSAVVTLAPTDPAPFAKMPLVWERAFGGSGFDDNPVGAGLKGRAGADGVPRLPNLEDPSHLVRAPGDTPAPICFAPIPTTWKARWSRLGTYDRRWFEQRWPYFPEDFDWGFSQAAPLPQQVPYLAGDETFSIVGMRPDTPRLDGRLPGIRARCFLQMTEDAGGDFREIPLVLDTAAFDADALELSLVWRAFVEVSDEEAPEIEAIFIAREDLDATPMTIVDARAAYVRAATPPPPEETDPQADPVVIDEDLGPPKNDIEAARAEIMEQLAAAGIPLSALEAPPVEPPPPPEPDAIAAALREGGATEAEVAEVLEAITPPPPDEDDAPPVDARTKVMAMLAAGEPFDGLDLAGANLEGLDFSGRSLVGTVLVGARIARASFAGAVLEGAALARADLTETVFREARLALADLAGVKAARADFTGAKLDEADFTGALLEGAFFDAAAGASTQLARARLAGASFRGADLRDADFSGANLDGAVLDDTSLPDVRLYDATAHGASFRNAKMKGARVECMRAERAIFANVDAPGSVWERAFLPDASFHGAVLAGASFARATCERVVFSTADLTEARFRRAKLAGASFLRANLMTATFERADLTGADLRGANLHAAETWKAKLDKAKLDHAIVTGSKLA
ncbi:Hypothetical protein A7982_02584 [Minicystis rosea]|nr:Hypothetical protein A7982_02584 [Minicystis rosea]